MIQVGIGYFLFAICSMTQSTEQNCILSASAYWKPCSFHLWIVHSFIPDPVLRAHYTRFSVAAYYYAQSFMLNQLLLSFSTSGAKLLILPLLIWCYLVLPFSYSFVSRSITEVWTLPFYWLTIYCYPPKIALLVVGIINCKLLFSSEEIIFVYLLTTLARS